VSGNQQLRPDGKQGHEAKSTGMCKETRFKKVENEVKVTKSHKKKQLRKRR